MRMLAVKGIQTSVLSQGKATSAAAVDILICSCVRMRERNILLYYVMKNTEQCSVKCILCVMSILATSLPVNKAICKNVNRSHGAIRRNVICYRTNISKYLVKK